MFLIWEIICLLTVLLQAQKITICWLRILVLLKKNKIDYDTILDGIYVLDSGLHFEELELCKIHSIYDNLGKTNLDLKTPGLNNPEPMC